MSTPRKINEILRKRTETKIEKKNENPIVKKMEDIVIKEDFYFAEKKATVDEVMDDFIVLDTDSTKNNTTEKAITKKIGKIGLKEASKGQGNLDDDMTDELRDEMINILNEQEEKAQDQVRRSPRIKTPPKSQIERIPEVNKTQTKSKSTIIARLRNEMSPKRISPKKEIKKKIAEQRN